MRDVFAATAPHELPTAARGRADGTAVPSAGSPDGAWAPCAPQRDVLWGRAQGRRTGAATAGDYSTVFAWGGAVGNAHDPTVLVHTYEK
eukprot:gene4387-32104_t